jgi:hypothetical protein
VLSEWTSLNAMHSPVPEHPPGGSSNSPSTGSMQLVADESTPNSITVEWLELSVTVIDVLNCEGCPVLIYGNPRSAMAQTTNTHLLYCVKNLSIKSIICEYICYVQEIQKSNHTDLLRVALILAITYIYHTQHQSNEQRVSFPERGHHETHSSIHNFCLDFFSSEKFFPASLRIDDRGKVRKLSHQPDRWTDAQ